MTQYNIERVDREDAHNRCQGVTPKGQCMNVVSEGSKFCPVHGGNRAAMAKEAENVRNYRLTKFQVRLNAMADSSHLKNLRDEIGILRIVMEELINKCNAPVDLLQMAPQIGDTALKIERLVTSCHKLDKSMGQFLDKSDIMQLGSEIATIISGYVEKDEAIDDIMGQIGEIIERIAETNTEKLD